MHGDGRGLQSDRRHDEPERRRQAVGRRRRRDADHRAGDQAERARLEPLLLAFRRRLGRRHGGHGSPFVDPPGQERARPRASVGAPAAGIRSVTDDELPDGDVRPPQPGPEAERSRGHDHRKPRGPHHPLSDAGTTDPPDAPEPVRSQHDGVAVPRAGLLDDLLGDAVLRRGGQESVRVDSVTGEASTASSTSSWASTGVSSGGTCMCCIRSRTWRTTTPAPERAASPEVRAARPDPSRTGPWQAAVVPTRRHLGRR